MKTLLQALYACMLLFLATDAPASAQNGDAIDREARGFISERKDEALRILNLPDRVQRYEALLEFVDETFDIPGIYRFTTARYYKQISPEQRQVIISFFKKNLLLGHVIAREGVSIGKLKLLVSDVGIENENTVARKITVTGSIAGSSDQTLIPYEAVLSYDGSRFRFYDIKLEGHSMLFAFRKKFADLIAINGNSMERLVEDLSLSVRMMEAEFRNKPLPSVVEYEIVVEE